jgi:hypothetical protein
MIECAVRFISCSGVFAASIHKPVPFTLYSAAMSSLSWCSFVFEVEPANGNSDDLYFRKQSFLFFSAKKKRPPSGAFYLFYQQMFKLVTYGLVFLI